MQENQQLEFHKLQLIGGLGQAAESLRTAASMADGFATVLQNTSFTGTPNAAAMNPMSMLQSFAQIFSGSTALAQQQQGSSTGGQPVSMPMHALQQPVPATPTTNGVKKSLASPDEDGESHVPAAGVDKKRKRGGEEKEKKVKKVKDPNAPKRAASAYLFFQNDVRKAMREQHASMPYSFVLGKISEAWAAMTEEERQPYTELALQGKLEYDRKKKDYEGKAGSADHVEAPTSPEDEVVIPETPNHSNSSDEASEASSDEDDEKIKSKQPPFKKSKPTKSNPATPADAKDAAPSSKPGTPLVKEKERREKEKEKEKEKKKKDKKKKSDA